MGNKSCKACGPGLHSSDGQSCFSDCQVEIYGQHYDFSLLPKYVNKLAKIPLARVSFSLSIFSTSRYVTVKGQPLFSSSGTHYFRLYNISLCGKQQFATCSDNVTYGVSFLLWFIPLILQYESFFHLFNTNVFVSTKLTNCQLRFRVTFAAQLWSLSLSME